MCFIKKVAVGLEDGTEKEYKLADNPWQSLGGSLEGDFKLAVADRTCYRIGARTVGEGKTLTLDWTALRDYSPGQFRVSVVTGNNPLKVKFHNDHGDWFCIRKDVDFYSDPETFEVDGQTVVLKANKRYLIEFFDEHITVEEYFDPEIMIALPDGS